MFSLVFRKSLVFSSVRNFSKSIGTSGGKFGKRTGVVKKVKTTAVAKNPADAWVSVFDESSGQIYWWNQVTDETTAVGVPKPTGATATPVVYSNSSNAVSPATQSSGGGIGSAIATGMAFGVGSSIGHSVIGSMFGGSSHGNSGGSEPAGGDSDGGEWDV